MAVVIRQMTEAGLRHLTDPGSARRARLPAQGHPRARVAESDPGRPRELEVLRLIVGGKSNKEIATLLDLSEGTVRTHVSNMLGKLGVSDRTQAATAALRLGIVTS